MPYKTFVNDSGGLHREDGPAVILINGTQEWWINNKLHRIGAPAIVRPDGAEEWWINGIRHRTDGPAYTGWSRSFEIWIIDNEDITNEVNEWMELNDIIWPWDKDIQIAFEMRFL